MLTKTNSIIHSLSTPVLITDVSFCLIESNEAAQNLFALNEKTLQGSIFNFIDCSKDALSKLLRNKKSSLENIRLLNVKNLLIEKTWTLKANECEINAEEEGYCFLLEESLEERYLSLEKERDFYKELLDNMPADVGVFNEDQKYLYVNPHAIKDPEMRKWIIGKDDFDYCKSRNIPTTIAKDRRDKFKSFLKNKSTYYSFEETSERNNIASHNLRIV